MDYTQIGLNSNLQSVNSPIIKNDDPSTLAISSLFDAPTGAINYTNLLPVARGYTAILSLSGNQGTFKDLQECINYVNRQGGGTILVSPGTYTFSKDITIYSDISIEGLVTTDCVFDFNNTSNNLILDTSASNIRLKNLTIKRCRDTSNGAVYIGTNCQQILLDNLIFQSNRSGTSGYDIKVDLGANLLTIQNCISIDAATFIYSVNYTFGANPRNQVINCNINETTNNAIWGSSMGQFSFQNVSATSDISCVRGTLIECSFTNCLFDQELVTGTITGDVVNISASNTSFYNCRFVSFLQGFQALDLNGGQQNKFIGCSFVDGDGGVNDQAILLTSVDDSYFSGCYIFGDKYGINISNGACERTIVIGNSIRGSTSLVNDSGTDSVIANNASF